MKRLLFLLVSIILVLSACGGSEGNEGASGGGNNGGESTAEPIVISGKPWTEQRILPYILANYIKAKTDYPVTVDEGIGETNVLHQAITDGDIDMYVEYTGTGLLAVLKKEFEPGVSPEKVYETVKESYEKKFHLTWLAPLGFQNTYSITVREETAEKYGIEKASDIAQYSDQFVFGGPATFYGRPDGYDYMIEAYDYHFQEHESLKPGLMYKALKEGEVDVIPAFTTDSRIKKYNLATTKDDKHIFPPYYAAPVVRMDTLEAYPKLDDVVNQLKGKISEEEMLSMNAKVDIERMKPEKVAKQFLKEKGLID